jgi:L-alanine-DL-glutamate epimerase-like enolase superfamily enzyme
MNRRCTLLLRLRTSSGIRGQIYIGDERDQQAAMCRILQQELFPNVLRRQASEVTAIWEEHFQRTTVSAGQRALMQALSALDVALWDVLGRQAGLPIFRLLGAAQTRLQTIIIGGYYEEGKGTVGLIGEIQSYREAGYAGVKFKVGGRPPIEDIERVRHVRNALGGDFIIACDANMGYTVADAIPLHAVWPTATLPGSKSPCIGTTRSAACAKCTPPLVYASPLDRVKCTAGAAATSSKAAPSTSSIPIGPSLVASPSGGVWQPTPRVIASSWRTTRNRCWPCTCSPRHHRGYPEYFAAVRDPVGAHLPTMAPPMHKGWIELPEAPGFGIEVDEAFVTRYRVDR